MAWQWYYNNKTDWWFIFQNWFNIMWEMHNKGLLQLHWSTHFLDKRDFNVGLLVWTMQCLTSSYHYSCFQHQQGSVWRHQRGWECWECWGGGDNHLGHEKTEILKFQHFLSTPSITIKWSETHPPVNKHYHRLNFRTLNSYHHKITCLQSKFILMVTVPVFQWLSCWFIIAIDWLIDWWVTLVWSMIDDSHRVKIIEEFRQSYFITSSW